jgi:predicted  nucleic acid-binding Zn-ribbon protein
MTDTSSAVKNLRERLTGASEDRLGKALTELLDNPLLIGTIERASTAREKAAQAQELAMGAFNIPSAADIERLTRRLRSVSQRLEGIEDGMQRLDRALASRGVDSSQIGDRLSKIEQQLGVLSSRLTERAARSVAAPGAEAGTSKPSPSRKTAASRSSKPGSPKRRKATPKKS